MPCYFAPTTVTEALHDLPLTPERVWQAIQGLTGPAPQGARPDIATEADSSIRVAPRASQSS